VPAPAREQKTGLTQSRFKGPIQWSEPEPAKSGVDGATLSTICSDMAQERHHDLKGIVIVRNGHLVSEHYFNGDSAGSLHDIRSATKSITSLLMGRRVLSTASRTQFLSIFPVCQKMERRRSCGPLRFPTNICPCSGLPLRDHSRIRSG
jgi:hypothetical protein